MKKIFTLIAAAFMAVGANAQTTISLAGLATDAFTFDANFYEASTYTEEGAEVSNPSFTYLGTGEYSALELTGKGVKFNYKNSDQKDNFFVCNADYFTIRGKGAQLIVTGLTKGQLVTISVAARSDDSTPSFAAQNALLQEGDPTALGTKDNFIDLTYVVAKDGDVTITESAKGYNIKSVTIAEGSGEIVINDGTYFLSFDGQTSGNVVEYAEGFKLQITGNDTKSISGGSNITIGDKKYKSMKVSNGAQNTLTLPDGKVASAITFYSYVNKSAATERDSYWAEIAGTAFTAEQEGVMFQAFTGNLDTPDKRVFSFGNSKLNTITFTNTGEQCCYVIEVTIESGSETIDGEAVAVTLAESNYVSGIQSVKADNIENGAVYNLAGQKVSDSFKGLVIKNGKKVMK